MTASAFSELNRRVRRYKGCRAHKYEPLKQPARRVSKAVYVQFTISMEGKAMLGQEAEARRQAVLKPKAALCIQKRWRGHRVRRQMGDPSHQLCRLRLLREWRQLDGN
jgi:hypothetical protein